MTSSSRGTRVAGWILVPLGLVTLLGALAAVLGPGLRTAEPVPFGQSMTVSLPAGDVGVYVTPSDVWSSIDCAAESGGEEMAPRPDMTMQDLLVPQRWDARGSLPMERPGTLEITCDGPVDDGRFTVGPVVSFFTVIGAVLLGVLGGVLLVVGAVLLAVARRRGTGAQPSSGRIWR